MLRRVMILGAGFEFCGLVIKAKQMGCYVVVCDGYADAPAKKLADKAYTVDVREIDAITDICKQERIDNIITSFSDILLECMVKISYAAGLQCYIKPEMLSAYREKSVTKEICQKAGIRTPRFAVLEEDFCEEAVAQFVYPCVLKPINGYGSRGIQVVYSIDELKNKFGKADIYKKGKILIEEMSHGQELNVMGYVIDGNVHIISIADRNTQQLWHDFVPVLYSVAYPSRIYDEVYSAVVEMLNKFVAYTGQKFGPIATQAFWTGSEIEVCEIAGRYFGFEHELAMYCNGIDIEQLLLDQRYEPKTATDTVRKLKAKGDNYATGIYLNTYKKGVVCDETSVSVLSEMPEVKEHVLFYRNGESVDKFGPKQYAVRYYLVSDSEKKLQEAEKRIYQEASIKGENGEELLWTPQINI